MDSAVFLYKLFISFCLIYLAGCAGPTKPDVPADLPLIGEGKGRIIFTREKQLAGAASPFIVIDIGESIEPNGMIYIEGLTLEEVLNQENIASEVGVGVDFLWFDLATVKPLYCADNGPGCIVFNWSGRYLPVPGLVFGTGIQVHKGPQSTCTLVADQPIEDEVFYKKLMRDELEQVDVSVDDVCLKGLYFGMTKRVLAFSYPPGSLYFITAPRRRGPSWAGGPGVVSTNILPPEELERQIQVIGSTEVGETLIWDRAPGIMRLGSVWPDGVGFMPRNLMVEAGKTYYIHYTTRFGQRWEVKENE
ncbi:MAG: hypothetical protein ABW098_08025 [Candidatus Thiodiazotropha sp.]